MKRILTSFWLIVAMLAMGVNAFAAEEVSDSTQVAESEAEFDMMGIITGHISDSHSWPIFEYENAEGEEVAIKLPLPVIAYHKGDWIFTLSSSFDEGATYEHNGYSYSIDAKGKLVAADGESVLDISITRNVASMFMSAALLLLLFVGAARSYKRSEVPHGRTSLVEMLVLFVKDIADDQIGKAKSAKYTPYLLTIFYFIWINNLIGLVPFFPFGTNLSGNIAFTSTLAIITFLITNVNASKHYWKHNLTVPGVPFILKFIMVPIEIMSMFTKPFTLLIRLFANVTGGHIIIISLISMIFMMQSYAMAVPSVLLALFVSGLELILGALQAYIFTVLSALYIGLAIEEE